MKCNMPKRPKPTKAGNKTLRDICTAMLLTGLTGDREAGKETGVNDKEEQNAKRIQT